MFFCTPQLVAGDLKTGRCPAGAVVLLVIDECHRAQGGASCGCGAGGGACAFNYKVGHAGARPL